MMLGIIVKFILFSIRIIEIIFQKELIFYLKKLIPKMMIIFFYSIMI